MGRFGIGFGIVRSTQRFQEDFALQNVNEFFVQVRFCLHSGQKRDIQENKRQTDERHRRPSATTKGPLPRPILSLGREYTFCKVYEKTNDSGAFEPEGPQQ